MAEINKASISVGSLQIFSPEASRTLLPTALVSVLDYDTGDPKIKAVDARFRFDFDELIPGDWNITFVKGGAVDEAGNTVSTNLTLYTFSALAAPPPSTDTSTSRVNTLTEITFTEPQGYELAGHITTKILTDEGIDVGGGVTTIIPNVVTLPYIGTPQIYELQHSGVYANGVPWSLTETIEILPAVVPFKDKLTAEMAIAADPVYTMGSGAQFPAIYFYVRFISPSQEDAADNSQIDHASLTEAIALKHVPTGVSVFFESGYENITRAGQSSVSAYRIARVLQSGEWAIIALAGTAKDEAGRTIPVEIELARFTAENYVLGAEQWDANNPLNPVLPRQTPASNSDLMGQIGGTTFIKNLFDLGVDPQVSMGATGMDAVEDMRITADGKFCVTAKVGLEQVWRLQVRHYYQFLGVDNEFTLDLGDHNGEIYLFISNNNRDEIPIVSYEGGLTNGLASIIQLGDSMAVYLRDDPTGTVTIKARNFDSWALEGDKSTVDGDGSDRKICIKQTSSVRYYEIAVGPRNQQSRTYGNGDAVRLPVGSSYIDWQARIISGSVQTFRIWRDESEAGQYPSDNFGWLRQTFGSVTYNLRVYSGDGFATAIAVRCEIEMDDGQVFTHAVTFQAAAVRAPGIFPLNFVENQVFEFGEIDTLKWQIGNPDPSGTLTDVSSFGITPRGQGQGASYGANGNLAATITFAQPISEAGSYGARVTYRSTTGEVATFEQYVTVNPEPPEPPSAPSLYASPPEVPIGGAAILLWGNGEFPSRERTETLIEISNADFFVETIQSISISTSQTSGSINYIPRYIGVYRARISISYADWPSAATSEYAEFSAVIPAAPEYLSVAYIKADNVLRIQWRESQIKTDGVFADRYAIALNGVETIYAGTQTTQNSSYKGYRWIDVVPPTVTASITVTAIWGDERTAASEPTEWVIYSDRTFDQMDSGAPDDLLAVKNAIASGPLAEQRALAAGDAELARTLNGGQAFMAYYNTYRLNTYDYWISVRDNTENNNLRAVAQQNSEWLFTPGQPGLLDALRECSGNGIQQACAFADSAEDVYWAYLEYVATHTPDTVLGIQDWIEAGRPSN